MRSYFVIPLAVACVALAIGQSPAVAAGVVIDELGGLAISEAGPTTDTYTVVLTSPPTATVTVNVTVSDGQTMVSNGGPFAASTSVSFDSIDWNLPKTITVQAVDDAVAEGSPHVGTINHSASSADPSYNGITINDGTADITDNDFAGVTINTGSGVDVDETGPTTDAYTIELDTPPTANVTISATADADTEVSTDNSTFSSSVLFTFTNGTWNTPQTVYVRAVDDAIVEGSHVSTITHSSASADGQYNGLSIASVLVNVTDNDLASFTINNSAVAVDEATPLVSDSFTIEIGSEPSGSLTITANADSQELVSKDNVTFSSSAVFTFDSGNWTTPQTVYVRAVDDFVVESNPHSGTITFSASGAAEYAFVTGLTLSVSIADNDVAGVIVSPTTVNVTEGGATDSYSIVLGSQPTADVTISFANVNGQVQAISPVTFTSATWNIAKTITVTAVDDGAVEGAHLDTIQHTVTSGDAGYNGFAASDVTVNITDNDSYAVVVSPTTVSVTEGGATDAYSVVLGAQPSADVTVSITPDSQVTTSQASLTFTSSDWSTPQSVTVTAVDDPVVEGAHTGTITHAASSTDPNFNGLSAASVTANITDNDSAGVMVTPTTVDVAEGGATDIYTIVLTTQPTADVIISFAAGSQLQAIASVTFTSADWNLARTITVAAVDDALAEGLHTGTINHTATSSDANYGGIAVASVTANITDNDSGGVFVSQISVDVGEDGTTATYSLVLTTQPTADVTINFDTGTQLEPIAPVTFTAGNWNVPQTITVTAIDDAVVEGPHSGTITHTATSGDPTYDGIAIASVTANITDNDAAPIPTTPIPTLSQWALLLLAAALAGLAMLRLGRSG